VRLSLIRRVASLLFVLAFTASAQSYAMPMMGPVKALDSMAGMTQGTPAGNCKGCDQTGAPMKGDCTTMCAAVFALALPVPPETRADRDSPRAWTSDTLATRAIAPDTSPPRA
jgi:hypothetical protein